MKKFLLAVVVVAIAAGAYVAGQYTGKDAAPSEMSDSKKPADPRITAAWQMMTGPWMSEEDSGLFLVYKNDGTFIETHSSAAGEARTEGEWSLFTAENPDEVEFQLNNESVYLKRTDAAAGTFYYRITAITPQTLEVVNMTKGGGMRFNRAAVGGEMAENPLTAVFRCGDDPHGFSATFPSMMTEVIIASEGEENVIPSVDSASGKKFEDAKWIFLFRGETVTVTDKATGTSEECTQPFSADNAPMNFGD
jgi:membrane-bound inhibitor of C-type lysozyme